MKGSLRSGPNNRTLHKHYDDILHEVRTNTDTNKRCEFFSQRCR